MKQFSLLVALSLSLSLFANAKSIPKDCLSKKYFEFVDDDDFDAPDGKPVRDLEPKPENLCQNLADLKTSLRAFSHSFEPNFFAIRRRISSNRLIV